jgi:hypothetical protein
VPGFVDLGEVHPVKAAIPELSGVEEGVAAERLRRILDRVRRLGLVGSRRGIEQTPEISFVLPAVARAFPDATLVHALRDGRDVVCSLLERGWLRSGRSGTDDAGIAYGSQARFWVEPGREGDFEAASDARRAAWAWRRYVSAVRESGVDVHEVRYESLGAAAGRSPAPSAATKASWPPRSAARTPTRSAASGATSRRRSWPTSRRRRRVAARNRLLGLLRSRR